MAEYGFWSYNTDGAEKMNPQKQTTKIFGTLTVGASNPSGSIVDPRFTAYTNHEPFYARIELDSGSLVTGPTWVITGNTLSWSYAAGVPLSTEKIIYGVVGKR